MRNNCLFIGDTVEYNNHLAKIVKIRKKDSETHYINDLNGVLISMITDSIIVTLDDGNDAPGTKIKKLK